jgi:hypothetical protein
MRRLSRRGKYSGISILDLQPSSIALKDKTTVQYDYCDNDDDYPVLNDALSSTRFFDDRLPVATKTPSMAQHADADYLEPTAIVLQLEGNYFSSDSKKRSNFTCLQSMRTTMVGLLRDDSNVLLDAKPRPEDNMRPNAAFVKRRENIIGGNETHKANQRFLDVHREPLVLMLP